MSSKIEVRNYRE